MEQRQIDTVNGYVRAEAKECLDARMEPYDNMPDLTLKLIWEYYRMTEFFTKYGDNIQYDERQNILSSNPKQSTHSCSAYGVIDIDMKKDEKYLYSWTIKMLEASQYGSCITWIGIDSSNRKVC